MSSSSSSDVEVLMRTADFAARKHSFQRRKDVASTPYINHPIGVANSLAQVGVTSVQILQAALLHDTVEDTQTTLHELKREFGDEVADIVNEVTDDKAAPKHVRKMDQVKHASKASEGARLVKLADKLYNLRSLQSSAPKEWNVERVQGYFVWSMNVVNAACGPHGNEVFADAFVQLKAELDAVFGASFTYSGDGHTYPCVPKVDDLDAFLQRYYESMAEPQNDD